MRARRSLLRDQRNRRENGRLRQYLAAQTALRRLTAERELPEDKARGR